MAIAAALSLLDEYDSRGLDKRLFQDKLHHLRASFGSFYSFAGKVNAFDPTQCNQLLLDRLNWIFAEIRVGARADSSGLTRLIEQSYVEVPCSRYPNCKGHKSDPHCKHRK
ncbi:MAG TPA: hypothetical protein VGJ21_17380 [Terracidiphilus sp.]|jgi:hypothetical protein